MNQHRKIIISLCLGAVAGLLIFSYLVLSDYRQTLRSAQRSAGDYAAVLQTRLDATLRRASASLGTLARKLPAPALSKRALTSYADSINGELDAHMVDFPELAGLRVFDSAGDQLYSSNRANTPFANVADRDYFLRLRDHPQEELVFSTVNISRTTGRPTLVLGKGLRDEQGVFLGVAIASVELAYFQKLFQSLDLGPAGVVSVYRSNDFSRVVSWPLVDEKSSATLPAGHPLRQFLASGQTMATLEYASAIDDVSRIYSFHALERFPFLVTVGLARTSVLADWKARTLGVATAGLLLLGLLGVLLLRLWRTEAGQARSLLALAQSEERYRIAFQTSPDAININRLSDGLYLDVNEGFERLMGWTRSEVVGKTSSELGIWRKLEHRERLVLTLQRDGFCENMEAEFVSKQGKVMAALMSARLIALDGVSCILSVSRDITERKAAEQLVQELAYVDPLTGLPNRRHLLIRLQQGLVTSARRQCLGALLLVDLDDFKVINDTLGHQQGDQLLEQVASRLMNCVRDGDTVARFGGDEFVVMLEDLSLNAGNAASQAESVAQKIRSALSQAYQLDYLTYFSSASIGITLFGAGDESIDEPLKRADLAMQQAKAAGRNSQRTFDPGMQTDVTARVELEASLREAVLKNQFVLCYQVQVTDAGRCAGVEALLRWQHPLRGLVLPIEFIAVAEQTGLILPLGQWVLETACTQLAQWARQPERAHLNMAVNVSARQFRQTDFVEQVLGVLTRTGARAERLKLELTESLLVSNVEDVIAKMEALQAHGVGFSLDDFGTGYSSLSYLKRMPLDQLKIDQCFVRDILHNPDDAAIAKLVIGLAQSLGLDVIAEGVETAEQQVFLTELGCQGFQGYLFGEAASIEACEALISYLSVSAALQAQRAG